MIYGYLCANDFSSAEAREVEINRYVASRNLTMEKLVQDEFSNKIGWRKRAIYDLLNDADRGDELVIYEAAELGRSTAQVLEVFEAMLQKGVICHLAKYQQIFTAEKTVNIQRFLEMMQHIESDFVAKRTTEALARRRDAGLPLGRPKGKKNKTLKLDKYKRDIQKYLDLRISKASIAKLIDCHPQTLYNYMEKRNLKETAS